jgi:hypothetical protein
LYSTCIFCHADLGRNESVEHFPIGRRLAFDAKRGRLWVVCRKCERWNLTPLEERWEAIEECERLFRDTRLRVSTDNIGLARLREGLELVRIGEPQRPEMAAWRYGDQFGRRRNKHLAYTGAGIAIAAGIIIVGPATGIIAGSSWGIWNIFTTANSAYQQRRVRARIALPGARELAAIRLKQLNRVAIVAAGDGWGLRVPYQEATRSTFQPNAVSFRMVDAGVERTAILTGEEAIQAASKLLPALNASGAKKTEVQSAVSIIEDAGDPRAVFARYGTRRINDGSARLAAGTEHVLAHLPKEVKLALEMASHEDAERRALEGELTVLEAAWQEAEEIAGIADRLFLSDETRQRLSSLKKTDE